MKDDAKQPDSPDKLPKARVRGNRWRRLFWLIPLAAAGAAAWFFYLELFSQGPTLHVYFDNASGLQGGKSQLKYRGVQIGSVDALELTKDNSRIKVTITLAGSAEQVAREGSEFWIVKPQVGLTQISGLQTIMGGDYVTVQPGTGKRQTEFRGLAEPPPTKKQQPGVRIMLLAEKLGSIKDHSPVFYHGVRVGEVSGTGLGPDAQTVRIYLDVERTYAPLVRMNSKFWNAGGVDINIGLSGIDINAQSAMTVLTGGIDFATPDVKEREAYDGAAFRLYPKAEPAWTRWFPTIRLPLIAQETPPPGKQQGERP